MKSVRKNPQLHFTDGRGCSTCWGRGQVQRLVFDRSGHPLYAQPRPGAVVQQRTEAVLCVCANRRPDSGTQRHGGGVMGSNLEAKHGAKARTPRGFISRPHRYRKADYEGRMDAWNIKLQMNRLSIPSS